MIYLITGIPGAGKTLYAVSTLVQSLMKDKVNDVDGNPIERRLLIDGIPALAVPHELLEKTLVEDKSVTVADGGNGFGNWWEWCKAGDVIVIDEVQRLCRPRAFSSKPPRMITELETHRHKGVDFVFITQNPMLIDQNVRRMVGRHQHVRRLFGMQRALIYEWDGCQSDTHRVSSAAKKVWNYPKDAYKLYASSEAHTKQKHTFPIWIALPVLAIVGGILVGPTAYASLSNAFTGKGLTNKPTEAPPPSRPFITSSPASAPSPVAPIPALAVSSPLGGLAAAEPVLSGCIKSQKACTCFDTTGHRMEVKAEICDSHIGEWHPDQNVFAMIKAPATDELVKDVERSQHDAKVFASMEKKALPAAK